MVGAQSKSFGRAGAGRQHDEVGLQPVEDFLRHRRAHGRDIGAGLAEIVGQRVDEAVLVVDEQDVDADRRRARWCARCWRHCPVLASRMAESMADAFSSVSASSSSGMLSKSSVAPARTSAMPSLMRMVRRVRPVFMSPLKLTMPIAPPYQARGIFSFCSMKLHGPEFRRAGDGDRPGMRQERVEGVHAFAQPALDMVDGVDQARIHLDLAAADDAHRARLADARLVVAVDVRAHGQLGFVLLGIEQLAGPARRREMASSPRLMVPEIGQVSTPAAVDAHEHLGRGADEMFALAEIDEEAIGRRVDARSAAQRCRTGVAAQRS